jgi:hypothetical protein
VKSLVFFGEAGRLAPSLARLALGVVLLGGVAGCSLQSRPRSLADADATRQAPATKEARESAPQAVLEADGFLADAEREQRAGHLAAANVLAERASAAYERAFVQARIVRSTAALETAKKQLTAAETENAAVVEEHTRLAAELADVETALKVQKDAPPLFASSKSDPMREPARREAASALATEARLLCLATKLVAPEAPGLAEATALSTEVDKILADKNKLAPIDEASRARAACLATLTKARRVAGGDVGDASDVLLAELSRTGTFAPVRDDRGVVVTVPRAFAGPQLAKGIGEQLDQLGKVAKAHPTMPVLVVIHDADLRAADEQRGTSRLAAAQTAVKTSAGDTTVQGVWVGGSRPVVDPKEKDHSRNERLEVIFVDSGKI